MVLPRLLRLLALGAVLALTAAACEDRSIVITQEKRGDTTTLFAEAVNLTEATITLSADLTNMRASPALPATVTLRGQRRIELGTLRPAGAGRWNFSYRYRWLYGSRGAKPDDAVYALPFAAGQRARLIQGPRGRFSHQAGSRDEQALDWALPEGTPVLAARGGVVIAVRQDSTHGGAGEQFRDCANYVVIRHADHTCAEYLHLRPGGARVRLGDTVQAGQLIGLSGNTGLSTTPHLHFALFTTLDGRTRQSFPVKFRLQDGRIVTPREGETY